MTLAPSPHCERQTNFVLRLSQSPPLESSPTVQNQSISISYQIFLLFSKVKVKYDKLKKTLCIWAAMDSSDTDEMACRPLQPRKSPKQIVKSNDGQTDSIEKHRQLNQAFVMASRKKKRRLLPKQVQNVLESQCLQQTDRFLFAFKEDFARYLGRRVLTFF